MILTAISYVKSRIDGAVFTIVRKTVLVSTAIVVMLFAAFFGLLAGYHALVSVARFTPIEAAGSVGGALVALGLLVLATMPFLAQSTRQTASSAIVAPAETLAIVDKSITKATAQVGVIPVIAAVFAVGFLTSRR